MMNYKVRNRMFMAVNCEDTQAAIDVMDDLGVRYSMKRAKNIDKKDFPDGLILFKVRCDYPTWVMVERVFTRNKSLICF